MSSDAERRPVLARSHNPGGDPADRAQRTQGRHLTDPIQNLNGILCARVTGCRWCDMPRQYGAYQTAWRRFR
ncbi:transposase, partial [Thermoflexus sp.]|uniref:transposase n=1 Tax=Thermoflexus sp. TaxID=1969742 RepID=UPI003C0882A9